MRVRQTLTLTLPLTDPRLPAQSTNFGLRSALGVQVMTERRGTAITLIMSGLLAGCQYLHSASLRVDVETYKGPLSRNIESQLGELTGLAVAIRNETCAPPSSAQSPTASEVIIKSACDAARTAQSEVATDGLVKAAIGAVDAAARNAEAVSSSAAQKAATADAEVAKAAQASRNAEAAATAASKAEQKAKQAKGDTAVAKAAKDTGIAARDANKEAAAAKGKADKALTDADQARASANVASTAVAQAAIKARDVATPIAENAIEGKCKSQLDPLRRRQCVALARTYWTVTQILNSKDRDIVTPSIQCTPQQQQQCQTARTSIARLATSMAEFAAVLKSVATDEALDEIFWAAQYQASGQMPDFNRFNAFAEASNQLTSRSDALLFYIDGITAGRKPEDLKLSLWIRDSTPTAFRNLEAWMHSRPMLDSQILFDADTKEMKYNKVRIVERLFADSYWSKINTVFAHGTGDTSIALIKDDIGNWNIKNFSSDPTEMVRSYTAVGRAALQIAASVAPTTEGLSLGAKALKLANTVNFGDPSAGQGKALDATVESLRKNLNTDVSKILDGLADAHDKRLQAVTDARNKAQDEAALRKAAAASACTTTSPDGIRTDASGLLGNAGTGSDVENARTAALASLQQADKDKQTACFELQRAHAWTEAAQKEQQRKALLDEASGKVAVLLTNHETLMRSLQTVAVQPEAASSAAATATAIAGKAIR
jgi:hypothetical protein